MIAHRRTPDDDIAFYLSFRERLVAALHRARLTGCTRHVQVFSEALKTLERRIREERTRAA